jgi:pimeloyl-ACP methyl ester carboxylesterase
MNTKLKMLWFIILLCMNASCSQNLPFETIKKGKPIVIDSQTYQTLEGFIDVPEDYQKANSRRLLIPFFVVKSPSKNPSTPIFWLDGGPGGSNIISEDKIASSNPSKILANHDFVCIGYRGVDGTTVLKSKKINKAMKGLHHQMLSASSLRNIEMKIKEYCAELEKSGININNYTIMDVIEDFEYARKFLGYKSINLLSVSYGTRVALLYSYKYPKVLNHSLMIGACPPGYFLTRPEQAEITLNRYDSIYKSQNATDYRGSIKEAMKKALDNLPKRWATFTLDADKIKAGTVGALYIRGFAVMAFDAYFKAAYEKDYSGLFMLQKIQDMNEVEAIGDVYAKTVSADKSVIEENAAMKRTQPEANTILGKNMALIYERTSKSWPIASIPSDFTKCRNTNVKTVIISGDLDFRTPAYITEKELMPYLPNGKHLVLKNMSHQDILMNTMKSPEFLQAYFDTGEANQSLLKTIDTIDFKPKNTISKAKIFVMGLIK